jgi:hypothetical protein
MDVTLRFWLGVGLALAALLGTAAPVAARDVPRDFYGTVLDGDVLGAPTAVLAQQWPRMASSGAETVRVVFSWSLAQPVARGPIDFSATDALVAGAAGHGLDVLPVVMYTPGWARADPTAVASPPARNADYTAYLTALVGRYGPDGSFWSAHPELPARPLRAWQIWNEPQLGYQWSTPGYVSGYGALLRDAYRALKSADPRCKVVLAGATNLSWQVFRRLYAKGGIRGFFDVAAVHPYTMEPANVLRILRLVRGCCAGMAMATCRSGSRSWASRHRAVGCPRPIRFRPRRTLPPGGSRAPIPCSRGIAPSCWWSACTGTRGCRRTAAPTCSTSPGSSGWTASAAWRRSRRRPPTCAARAGTRAVARRQSVCAREGQDTRH